MFFLIGLGLGNVKDISVAGLEKVRSCDLVFLEHYTSVLPGTSVEELSEFYGVKVQLADRELVESHIEEEVLEPSRSRNVALLVVGDPYGATTHTDLVLRASELGLHWEVVHNCSIMNAIGCTGLQLYRFGQAVSMVFFTETWRPDSWLGKIEANSSINLHTLVLVDIKVKEQSEANLLRGRKIYEPPRFMTAAQCVQQLLEKGEESGSKHVHGGALAVAVARVGHESQQMAFGTLEQLRDYDMGPPLHSVVLCAPELHELELQFLNQFRIPTAAD